MHYQGTFGDDLTQAKTQVSWHDGSTLTVALFVHQDFGQQVTCLALPLL